MKAPEHKRISFALSFIQGFGGGLLGGFAYMVLFLSQQSIHSLNLAILVTPYFLITGIFVGSIGAMFMWGIQRLTGVRLGARARVGVASIVSTSLVAFGVLYLEIREDEITSFLMVALSMAIPVALLVGSRVKPWEFFTFGTIAVGEVDHRSGSRSICGTLGSLPLRFLGIGTTAYILLKIISNLQPIDNLLQAQVAFILLAFFAAYPAYSAYVTFRSPRKVSLCAIAVVLNAPIALIGLFSYHIYTNSYWIHDTPPITSILCGSFVVAWLIFLVARLNAKIDSEYGERICELPSLEQTVLSAHT